MRSFLRLLASLALCAAAGAPSACQAPHAARLVLSADRQRSASLVLTPRWPRHLLLTRAWAREDVELLVIKLFRMDDDLPTEVARADLDKAHLSSSVSFTQLRPATTYRIQGFAYRTSGEDPEALISTQDASSSLEVALTDDDRPTLAALSIQLQDVPASVVTTVAGQGAASNEDGWAMAAQFNRPSGVALDAAGNLYVTDYGNSRIRKITPAGAVSTLAGSIYGHADGTGANAQFATPYGIVIDAAGNLYVSDNNSHRIRKLTPEGVVTTFAGDGYAGSVDGTGAGARFNGPRGLAIDTAGNLYVADTSNQRIRKITPDGVVTTLAGNGTQGFADGTGTSAQFNSPRGLAVDEAGNLYVADAGNHRIRKVTPAGIVSTLAGAGTPGFADGTSTSAQFKGPMGVAVDASGNLYVLDTNNFRLRTITPGGVVTTLAGAGTSGFADGTSSSAKFNSAMGITLDASGNLYVADVLNNRIRKIH